MFFLFPKEFKVNTLLYLAFALVLYHILGWSLRLLARWMV